MLIELFEDYYINSDIIEEMQIQEEEDAVALFGKGNFVVIINCAYASNVMIKEISIAFSTYKEARDYTRRLAEKTKAYMVH